MQKKLLVSAYFLRLKEPNKLKNFFVVCYFLFMMIEECWELPVRYMAIFLLKGIDDISKSWKRQVDGFSFIKSSTPCLCLKHTLTSPKVD